MAYPANDALWGGVHSFGVSAEKAFHATAGKIKELLKSPVAQGVIGFGLGLGMHKIYGPLTAKIVKILGKALGASLLFPGSVGAQDPFNSIPFEWKILISPFVCIIGPILEERDFRGKIQTGLKDKLYSFYKNSGLSDAKANIASRVTAVFFSSILFGLGHFTNALIFWCNPFLFLPQVIAATIMGLLFGVAKELTNELHMPIGMHIGNNTLAWMQKLYLI